MSFDPSLIGALLRQLHRLTVSDAPWDEKLPRRERRLIIQAAVVLIGQTGELLQQWSAGDDVEEQLEDLIGAADQLATALALDARATVAELAKPAVIEPAAAEPDLPIAVPAAPDPEPWAPPATRPFAPRPFGPGIDRQPRPEPAVWPRDNVWGGARRPVTPRWQTGQSSIPGRAGAVYSNSTAVMTARSVLASSS